MVQPTIANLQCPVPTLDFETIHLGHGSGGLLTHRLLEAGVFALFDNELLGKKHDGAVFNLQGKLAMSTDTFVVSPLFFPGGNIGDLAVNGTVNDLAMCGARPKYLTLGLVLEEGLPVSNLLTILHSIKDACTRAGVSIITGDTKVVEKGKGDGIFINTTGIGEIHQQASIDIDNIRPGDQIILSGPLARHGIAIMSLREGLEFETTINSDTRPLNNIVLSLLDNFGSDIRFLRDPTRGGVATVLNEIVAGAGFGVHINQTVIPVDEEVNGACEMLGLDPLYVANEGLFIAIVSPQIATACLDQLRQWEFGSQAAIIGQIVDDHAGQVIMTSGIGGRRVINMLAGEQLPRIC